MSGSGALSGAGPSGSDAPTLGALVDSKQDTANRCSRGGVGENPGGRGVPALSQGGGGPRASHPGTELWDPLGQEVLR